MLDHNKLAIDQVTLWNKRDSDDENSINGFNGEFAFTDHSLVPEALRALVIETYPRKESFTKVPLKDINALLNSVWQGPGSMPRIVMLTHQLREIARRGSPVSPVTEETTVEEFCEARSYHSSEDIVDD